MTVKDFKITALVCIIAIVCSSFSGVTAMAESKDIKLTPVCYSISDDSKYKPAEGDVSTGSSVSGISVSGDVAEQYEENGYSCFIVNDGLLNLSFSHSKAIGANGWQLSEDKGKEIDGIKLKDNIGKGALIIQSSTDGERWVTDYTAFDVFDGNADGNVYSTKNIQLVNGCYYKIMVAYRTEKQLEDKKLLFVELDNFTYEKHLEVYTFYARYNKAVASASDDPKMILGNLVKTETGKGYSGTKEIDIKDPHYGWSIGNFTINGFTDVIKTDKNNPVFLKTVGDDVTLWFTLSQNIDMLNNDKDLSIAEDTKGYDQYFSTNPTDFKHGALIIKYTNEKNETRTDTYTDYLAANAVTGAETRVQLYEEGDYEIALDYKIKKDPRKIAGVSVVPTYTDYRIYFKFSIRNGNCMIFPKDLKTGSDLTNNEIALNGFKLDLAKSKYLKINVEKISIQKGTNGLYSEDVRFNRAARDGEEYKDPGVYTFVVSNDYTGKETTKTIYVGDDKIIKALAINGIDVDELNSLIKSGAKIDTDGSIITK